MGEIQLRVRHSIGPQPTVLIVFVTYTSVLDILTECGVIGGNKLAVFLNWSEMSQ
jgi:hypothetical protein